MADDPALASGAAGGHQSGVFLTQGNEAGVDLHAHGDESGGSGVHEGALGIGGHDHVSQSTRLHHKMREMKEMDDALALMKSDYADRVKAVKDGESKFLVKQHNIIKYLRRFKLFILESDTKRARAEKKEAEEHRQRNVKIKEIDQLRAQFLQLQQTRSDLKQKNDHYKQNKQYLESVKDAVQEQYGEIDELIVRHQILKQTNTDLTESNRIVSEKMEAITGELQTLSKTKQNDILVKNSKFASLLQKLETVTNETSSIENEVVAVEVRTRDMNRYFCEVQMAIQNIYARTMSSLPSAKAASQMKKRMHQAAAAAANGAVPLDDALQSNSASSSLPGSRLGTAGSLLGGSDLDSDLSDTEGGETGPNAPAATGASPAEEAALRAATAATNRTMALKQQSVKQHLISRLDAIMERIEDLQDIVDHCQPGLSAVLRESGSIYNAPSLHLLAASSNANATTTDRHRTARRSGSGSGPHQSSSTTYRSSLDPSMDSSARRTSRAPPTPSMQSSSMKRGRKYGGSGGLHSDSESEEKPRDEYIERIEAEKKFRQINSLLAAAVPGFLGDKPEIPADQLARRGAGARHLPPVRGAHSASTSAGTSTKATPNPSPRRGH